MGNRCQHKWCCHDNTELAVFRLKQPGGPHATRTKMQSNDSMLKHNSLPTLLIFLLFHFGCSTTGVTADPLAPTKQVRVINIFDHDPAAFTQGLVVEGETIYEGTGRRGASTLRKVDLPSGTVEKQVGLPRQYFGEGITIFGDRIYQLTWEERVCVVYEKESFKALGTLPFQGVGWGITDDEKHIYMSNGSNKILVRDPQTFRVLREITVKHGRRNINNLNELEFVNGKILANIWYEDKIAEIDPATGAVTSWIDCSGVYPAATRPDREHVLNGIAYDETSGRLFITGKNWPKLYEIEIVN